MKKMIPWFVLVMVIGTVSMTYAGEVSGVVEQVAVVANELPNMKELTNKALAEMVNSFVAVKDFTVEQVPLVLKELLRWHFAISLLWFIVASALTITLVTSLIRWKNYMYADGFNVNLQMDGFPRPAALVLTGVCTCWLPIMIFSLGDSLVWLQIWLAPRVYLIEYAAELLK